MNYGRERDLYDLHRQMHDTKLPMWRRKAANRTFVQIQDQLRDRRLMGLRESLLKANAANDKLYIWKITNQMKDYLKEPLIPMEDMV